jgi:hypothetical protein
MPSGAWGACTFATYTSLAGVHRIIQQLEHGLGVIQNTVYRFPEKPFPDYVFDE